MFSTVYGPFTGSNKFNRPPISWSVVPQNRKVATTIISRDVKQINIE